jgi:hypothetical protein
MVNHRLDRLTSYNLYHFTFCNSLEYNKPLFSKKCLAFVLSRKKSLGEVKHEVYEKVLGGGHPPAEIPPDGS